MNKEIEIRQLVGRGKRVSYGKITVNAFGIEKNCLKLVAKRK